MESASESQENILNLGPAERDFINYMSLLMDQSNEWDISKALLEKKKSCDLLIRGEQLDSDYLITYPELSDGCTKRKRKPSRPRKARKPRKSKITCAARKRKRANSRLNDSTSTRRRKRAKVQPKPRCAARRRKPACRPKKASPKRKRINTPECSYSDLGTYGIFDAILWEWSGYYPQPVISADHQSLTICEIDPTQQDA